MKPTPMVRKKALRLGFTLVELLVVIGIIALLISVLLPALSRAKETANRVKCAANLRAFGQVMKLYANDNNGFYPRTNGDVTTTPNTDSTGYNDNDPFNPTPGPSTITQCNVTASIFLLARSNNVSMEMFICPSSQGVRLTYTAGGPLLHSNFNQIPGGDNAASPGTQGNTSYSMQCPFPQQTGSDDGFKWNDTLNNDFALMADLNPGVYATGGPNKVNLTSTASQVQAGNSPNHNREGQNVLFNDYHVEFWKTPFCGVDKDNIYGPGVGDVGAGNVQTPDAVTPLNKGSMHKNDSVLLPALGAYN